MFELPVSIAAPGFAPSNIPRVYTDAPYPFLPVLLLVLAWPIVLSATPVSNPL